ncbi:divalent-cation tolerance protein CutA [Chloroflexota bacterium]
MEESSYITIFITVSTRAEADNIAGVLLNERRVACTNIIPEVSSLFRWREKLDSAQECLLIAKTKASQLDEVVRLVKENHSYQVPETIAMPIVGGNRDYLEWIDNEVDNGPESGEKI